MFDEEAIFKKLSSIKVTDVEEEVKPVNTDYKKKKVGAFQDKLLVFTGKLETRTRAEAQAEVIDMGGKVAGAVTKNTDYLVVGGTGYGKKLDDAKSKGVTILKEKEYKEIVEEEQRMRTLEPSIFEYVVNNNAHWDLDQVKLLYDKLNII